MATATQDTAFRQTWLLREATAAPGPVAAASTHNGMLRATGLGRVVGQYVTDAAPAAGFPRVRFSEDGITWTVSRQIAQDLTQANLAYVFDLPVEGPYVSVEFTVGGAPGTFMYAGAAFEPESAGPASSGGAALGAGAVQVSGTSPALVGGTETLDVRTVAVGVLETLESVAVFYTGTVAGVTLALRIGAVDVTVPVVPVVSGVALYLMPPGMRISAQAADVVRVQVTGGTAGDTVSWRLSIRQET